MIWSKMKQQLENFLSDDLVGIIEYSNSSYRYSNDSPGRCYITVNKKNIFNMVDNSFGIQWFKTKEEIIKSDYLSIRVSQEELDEVSNKSGHTIPKDRLEGIVRKRKSTEYADAIINSSKALSRSDFNKIAERYLSSSLETSLYSDDILLNVFALMDRRLGKKRLQSLEDEIQRKHPVVQYFYYLRKKGSRND